MILEMFILPVKNACVSNKVEHPQLLQSSLQNISISEIECSTSTSSLGEKWIYNWKSLILRCEIMIESQLSVRLTLDANLFLN